MKLKKIAVEEAIGPAHCKKQCVIAFGITGLVVADTKGKHTR
jgi:hypothetical protein